MAAPAPIPIPATELVGRAEELDLIRQAFADDACRLVTLTGPPGVGKTHLAVVAAANSVAQFADGEVFVDLGQANRLHSALGEIARAVGSSAAPAELAVDRLIDGIGRREILLVLDNCEHLLPVPELAPVLAQCPNLHILATSRERLRLAAEREITVHPLQVPEDLDDADKIASSSSVRLLVRRARAVQHDFAVTPGNARQVGEVCIRLDGLPLALELAAAQLKMFTPGELAYRLNRSTLLRGGLDDMPERHRGLRVAIGWSFRLMTQTERALFRRLAVFADGWTLAAAEAVCGGRPLSAAEAQPVDVAAVTASLVDKSIIRRATRPDGVTAFSMLGSVREFAAEQLAEHEEEEAARARHVRFYAGVADEAEKHIGTPDEDTWVERVEFARDNLRAALDHSLAIGDAAAGLRLAAAMGWYWYTRGYVGEGRVILDRMLGVVDGDDPALTGPLAAALLTAGILAWSQGDNTKAIDLLAHSSRLSETTDDVRRVAVSRAFSGHVARDNGEFDLAKTHYAAATAIFESVDDRRGCAWGRFDLGMLAWLRGDVDTAARHFADCLGDFRDVAYPWAVACASWGLAGVEVYRGNVNAAVPHAAEALEEYTRLDDRRSQAQCLELAALIASERGTDETAGRLLGAAEAIRHALAAPGTRVETNVRGRAEHAVRRALGEARAKRALRAGGDLPVSSVLALARRVLGTTPSAAEPQAAWPTPREREVAALVAAGCTNRVIGRELRISEKTVEVHVRNTMGKLGCRSRAEIAAWAVTHGIYQPGDTPYT